MNKFLTKIAGVVASIAMVIGVGVGVASKAAKGAYADSTWDEISSINLASDDVIVIVDKTSSRAMSNDNGTGSAPSATEVTLNGDKDTITSEVADALKWTVTVTNDGFKFAKYGNDDKFLYCTNTNNGVRVGTNSNNVFTIKNNYLHNTGTSRYLGVYNEQDWRCYNSTGGNIADTRYAFYKYSSGGEPSKIATTTTITVPDNKTTLDLAAAQTDTVSLSAAVTYQGGSVSNPSITWTSSRQNVATVTNGLVTPLARGTTTITATYASDETYFGSSAEVEITVINSSEIVFDFAAIAAASSFSAVSSRNLS